MMGLFHTPSQPKLRSAVASSAAASTAKTPCVTSTPTRHDDDIHDAQCESAVSPPVAVNATNVKDISRIPSRESIGLYADVTRTMFSGPSPANATHDSDAASTCDSTHTTRKATIWWSEEMDALIAHRDKHAESMAEIVEDPKGKYFFENMTRPKTSFTYGAEQPVNLCRPLRRPISFKEQVTEKVVTAACAVSTVLMSAYRSARKQKATVTRFAHAGLNSSYIDEADDDTTYAKGDMHPPNTVKRNPVVDVRKPLQFDDETPSVLKVKPPLNKKKSAERIASLSQRRTSWSSASFPPYGLPPAYVVVVPKSSCNNSFIQVGSMLLDITLNIARLIFFALIFFIAITCFISWAQSGDEVLVNSASTELRKQADYMLAKSATMSVTWHSSAANLQWQQRDNVCLANSADWILNGRNFTSE